MSAHAEPQSLIPEGLKKYYDRGFRLIFYDAKQKGPSGPEALRWTERSDQIGDYRPGQNVGVFTGEELTPGCVPSGKFLADIDFDWPDGLPLAKAILPDTGFGFGRESRTISHAFYTTPEPVQSVSFDGINGKPYVELRGTKKDGTVGLQTMVPPSVHPKGEELVLRVDEEIAHCAELRRLTALYATGCILLEHLGHRGLLHDQRLSVPGLLMQLGLSVEEVTTVTVAIATATGNDVQDLHQAIKTTAARFNAGEHVTGATALATAIGDDGRRVVARIREWLGASEFVCKPRSNTPIADHYDNLCVALDKLGVQLAFNIFNQEVQVTWNGALTLLDDAVRNRMWFEIEREFRFRPSAGYFDTFLQDVAQQHRFHPVRDYLDGLIWDGTPRLDRWLRTYGGAADNEYTRAVGSLVLVAAVRRVRQPGCKFDEMPVLESEQGLGKSTAIASLCPNEDWFSDGLPLNADSKELIERTLGKWIIEASDLHGYRDADVEHLKALLSRRVDGPVRLAYARMPTQRQRHFIVIGTTNSHVYLKDATGNRRFWPVRIEKFDIDKLRADRDQLWAEAAKLEAEGESIRLDPALYNVAALQQERRRQSDPWEEALDEAFPRSETLRLTWNEIYAAIGMSEIGRRDERSRTRLLKILQRLGFHSMPVKHKGKVSRGMGRDAVQGELPVTNEINDE